MGSVCASRWVPVRALTRAKRSWRVSMGGDPDVARRPAARRTFCGGTGARRARRTRLGRCRSARGQSTVLRCSVIRQVMRTAAYTVRTARRSAPLAAWPMLGVAAPRRNRPRPRRGAFGTRYRPCRWPPVLPRQPSAHRPWRLLRNQRRLTPRDFRCRTVNRGSAVRGCKSASTRPSWYPTRVRLRRSGRTCPRR